MWSGRKNAQVASTFRRKRQCWGTLAISLCQAQFLCSWADRQSCSQQRETQVAEKSRKQAHWFYLCVMLGKKWLQPQETLHWMNEHSRTNSATWEVKPFHFSEPPFLLLYIRNVIIPTCQVASRVEKEHTLECSLWGPKHHTKRNQNMTSSVVLCLNLAQILIFKWLKAGQFSHWYSSNKGNLNYKNIQYYFHRIL